MNLFPIANAAALRVTVALYEVAGLPLGDPYEKSIDELRGAVARDTHGPVAVVRRGAQTLLAVPAGGQQPAAEYPLMPVAARLERRGERLIDLAQPDAEQLAIGTRFLEFALRTPLRGDFSRWGMGRTYYDKTPLNVNDRAARIDIYPGFVWSVVVHQGTLALALDVTNGYIERGWLIDQWTAQPHGDPKRFNGRIVLYHFGPQWYTVKLKSITGQSISEQRFPIMENGQQRIIDVLAYTREKHGIDPRVRGLDPASPAITYESRGRPSDSSAALALCKLTVQTKDAPELQRQSILEPPVRMDRIRQTVRKEFQRGRFFGTPIEISPEPLEIERRVFRVPAHQFGQNHTLAVEGADTPSGAEVVSLADLGRRRLRLLTDVRVGPLSRQPFGPQYAFVPEQMPRGIADALVGEFERQMAELSARTDYKIELVLYPDTGPSLPTQRQAVQNVVREHRAGRGHALFVLPPGAHHLLHNTLKQDFGMALQVQCVDAHKLGTFFDRNGGQYVVAERTRSIFRSYVRNLVLPMLELNRHWLWSLATPLHYDLHIGVDVLNGTAGITLVADGARHIAFSHHAAFRHEKLARRQVRQILRDEIAAFVRPLGVRPRSILVQRDGRVFTTEIEGINLAFADLQRDGVLGLDTRVDIVELRKRNASGLRLFEGVALGALHNPLIGSWSMQAPRDAIVALTGQPFRLRGTANPLSVHLADGDGPLEDSLEDIFALSQLAFTAPDQCSKLPITIKLCDDFLRPIASRVDAAAGTYGEDEVDEDEDGEVTESSADATAGTAR